MTGVEVGFRAASFLLLLPLALGFLGAALVCFGTSRGTASLAIAATAERKMALGPEPSPPEAISSRAAFRARPCAIFCCNRCHKTAVMTPVQVAFQKVSGLSYQRFGAVLRAPEVLVPAARGFRGVMGGWLGQFNS